MLRHYLLIVFRNVQRHRVYAALNIAGLAVGMACAVLIGLYVQDELSFDRYHAEADRMYRLVAGTESDAYDAIAKIPAPWAPAVEAALPEVEATTRLRFLGQTLVSRGETRAYQSGAFTADASVFEVFSGFNLLRGETEGALAAPNSLVLTETFAETYFGEEDPLGQTLTFGQDRLMTVTGVMADVPPNSHFSFPFLVSRASEQDSLRFDWRRTQYYTYVRLADGADPAAVGAKVSDVLRQQQGDEYAERYAPWLQAVPSIHLHSNLFREMQANADVSYVYIFSALAFFILLLACINFMNLATARSARRAREVGVRKASGAPRGALVRQFLGEALLLSFLALALALVLVSLLLPSFNALTGKTLTFAMLLQGPLLLGLLGLTVFVGVVSGSYPAFVLSAFRPAEVLKGHVVAGGHRRLRRGLVVFQFAVTAFLLVAVGVVRDQLGFIQEKNLGFNEEQIVVLPIRENSMREQIEAFKAALRAHPGVVSVAASANLPGGGDFGIPLQPEGFGPEDDVPSARILAVDRDFLKTFQFELTEGRGFDDVAISDSTSAFLLNERTARAYEWDDPVGKRIAMQGVGIGPSPVVGIVKDFHYRSLREEIAPLVFFVPPPSWFSNVSVRIRPDAIGETLAHLEATWAQFEPGHPFTYSFLDEQFAGLYAAERRVAQILGWATVLAILIACLGLFGLAAYTAERRTKEIGIRKVMGASVPGLVGLLSKDFLRLVAVAFVVAAPLAYFAMHRWLENFAYQTEVQAATFLLAAALALAIALLTISFQAIRAALANPVKSLRYE